MGWWIKDRAIFYALRCCVGGLMLFCAAGSAPIAFAAPTQEENAATVAAEQRGLLMFAYDQAAWRATDQFLSDLRSSDQKIESLTAQGLRGYIVEPIEGSALLVTFYGKADGNHWAIARYRVEDGAVKLGGLVTGRADRQLSPLALRIAKVRNIAAEEMKNPGHELCSSAPINTLVVPSGDGGGLAAYILTPATESGSYPAGGHFRFDFDASDRLLGERRFMKSCFTINYRTQEGKTPEIMVVSHLLDPQPTEVHAFVSLNVPIPLGVVTAANRRLWLVSSGRIRFASEMSGVK